MQIFDRRDAFLRFHVFGNQLHRSRSIQRDQRDDVVELLDLELLRQIRHAARFHLEQANSVAAIVEIERGFVVERNIF